MFQAGKSIERLQRQRLLLELEYATEKEAFAQQTKAVGIGRAVHRGDAWVDIDVGRSFYNSLNMLCIEIFRRTEQEIEHNFEYGRPVVFFSYTTHPITTVSYLRFSATVAVADGDRMVVVVPDTSAAAALQNGGPYLGVQLSFDETTYRLMFQALDRVIAARDNRLAQLRDLFDSRQPAGTYQFGNIRLPWLNKSQEEAVNQILKAKDVMVVHGPPGTGKTTTLVEAIHETLRRENQVLVCAQSNMAVDWIAERLADRGISVLRIGNPTRVTDKMLAFTYERQFESHPDYPQLWALRKAIRELRGSRHARGDAYHQKLESLKSRATEIELRIQHQLFDDARVIASTLTGAANKLLDGQKYNTLFIDEAAQALEAACWIAIRRAHRVVFAGDYCQLPPTIKSIAALKAGLGVTLMEHISKQKPEVVRLLKTQYRMNEKIMRFSSDWFYDGKVESAPEVRYRGVLDYDIPLSWIDSCGADPDHDFSETFVGENFGRINHAEAQITVKTLEEYFRKIGKQRILDEHIDVGVISPYRAQVQHLRKLLRKNAFFKPYAQLITVNTIDGFQGQERDVIFISMVRSNKEGQIGFLNDLRRMNVAITRARMKLFIVGDSQTLCRHRFYRQLYEYVKYEKNCLYQ